MGKGPEQTLLQRGHTDANGHMKRCSMSLLMSEMQTATTMRRHHTPVRMANNNEQPKCWRGRGEEGPLMHCWCECTLGRPLWKQYGATSKIKSGTALGPRDSTSGNTS